MNKTLTYGGYIAAIVLVIGGLGMIVAGAVGQSDVRDRLANEGIVGTPDMNPQDIDAAYAEEVPDCDVAGELIDTGSKAQCFADYLRIHQLTNTNGQTYAEMDRFVDEQGNPTSDEAEAARNPETGAPMANQAREGWVTATALTTALNMSFFAESVAMFSIAVGVILILIGVGLAILTKFALAPRLLQEE